MFVLCSTLQAPGPTAWSSASAAGPSALLAADAAPQAKLQETGGAQPLDPQHAQWPAEAGDDPHELLRARPGESPALRARDGYGPFVGPVLRAPHLDGLQRPPSLTRLAA